MCAVRFEAARRGFLEWCELFGSCRRIPRLLQRLICLQRVAKICVISRPPDPVPCLMDAHSSYSLLRDKLCESDGTLDHLTVEQGFRTMFEFYRHERAEDCSPDADGDMLLYQWGTYDWGEGEAFEIDLTRQFLTDDPEDENMWQLSLRFRFLPTDPLRALGDGNKWCPEPRPGAVDYLKKFVRDSAAFRAVNQAQPMKVDLTFTQVD